MANLATIISIPFSTGIALSGGVTRWKLAGDGQDVSGRLLRRRAVARAPAAAKQNR